LCEQVQTYWCDCIRECSPLDYRGGLVVAVVQVDSAPFTRQEKRETREEDTVLDQRDGVVPVSVQEDRAHSALQREHEGVEERAGAAVVTGPTTHGLYRKLSSRHGTVINIDDLDLETEHAALVAENAAEEAHTQAKVEQEQTRNPASGPQQTLETKPVTKPPRKCGKRWWKIQLADLWYIIRKEHLLIGIIVPLNEELTVFTRFQRLVCYYVEIQLALAAVGMFVSTS